VQGRGATLAYLPHPDACSRCEVVAALTAARDDLATRDARGVLVLGGLARVAAPRELVALDREGAARRGCGTGKGASLLVADRYGEVWEHHLVGKHHALPTTNELVATVRLMALQCPECGVPDSAPLDRLPEPRSMPEGR